MKGKTFNRYIWLLNLLLEKKKLTYEEISDLWKGSSIGNHKPIPLRTFHEHRDAIKDIFGVEIKCNPSDHYCYFINDLENMRNDKAKQWLLNSFTLSNMIQAGHNMNDRIIFEEIPHGTEYLQPVIDAMEKGNILEIDYQAFGASRRTYHMEVYAMKVYHQRWYMAGRIEGKDAIRHLALDRILELKVTGDKYKVPKTFNAKKYYANTIGIFVNEELKPQKVRIRVYGKQVEYLRTLPLHSSQEEVVTKLDEYSEFQYRLCLTPELSSQLLAMGENVEVLLPEELREEIKKRLLTCLTHYK